MAIGYISQLVVSIMIIIYCILLPSLFSTLDLLFMLVGITVIIAPVYRHRELDEVGDDKNYFVAHSLPKLIWGLFTLANVGMLIFKIVYYFTGSKEDMAPSLVKFFEL